MAELTVVAAVENLAVVTAFVDDFLEACGCPMRTQIQMDVAVDEIFSNITRYAYPGGEGSVTVRLSYSAEPPRVTAAFLDEGIPYDPLTHQDPDITLSAEERQIGGLGIFMVKKTMDSVSYAYEGGQNRLTIQKGW